MAPPVALITGASGKLGPLIARAAAESGYALALAAHRGRVAALPPDVIAHRFSADLRRPGSAAALVRRVERKLGPVQVLLHAAGGFLTGPLLSLDRGRFDEELAVHAGAFLSLVQAVRPGMRRGGRIVAFGLEGLETPRAYRQIAAHAAAKAAALVLTLSLAGELSAAGVQVHAVALPRDPSPASLRQVLRRLLSERGDGRVGRVHPVAAAPRSGPSAPRAPRRGGNSM